jgi:hypothetical protein
MTGKEKFNKVAVRVNGPLFDRTLGRLDFGYAVLDEDIASQWINRFSDKVTIITPEELASVYGNSKKK